MMTNAIRENANSDLVKNVRHCYKLGFSFIPLNGKIPISKGWTKQPRASLKESLQWASQGNVGVRTGQVSDDIVVIDVDEGGDVSPFDLPPTVTVKTGGNGKHYYFECDVPLRNSTNVLGSHIDVRADGGQVVFPGSVHPDTNDVYEWKKGCAPWEIEIAKLPKRIIDQLRARRVRKKFIDANNDNGSMIHKGGRNSHLASIAGALRGRGSTYEVIEIALLRENHARCCPPLPDSEVCNIARSYSQYSADNKHFALTDTGLAERFVAQHGEDVRYCRPWGKWLIWDSKFWHVDDTGAVEQLVKKTVQTIIIEASQEEDLEKRKELLKFARSAESVARRDAMLRLARSELPIPIRPDVLDKNNWLLNCSNGTINLKTGKLQPHNRKDFITKLCEVEYDPKTKCPRFQAFLQEIFANNDDLIRFIWRLLGYCLTGIVTEQVLPILYGVGANGKSTLTSLFLDLLGGDYAIKAPADFLMVKRNDAHPTALTDLHGKRLIVANETEDGRRLQEALVKELTGGDKIRARRMHEDFWQFDPTHKILIATNHKPEVSGTDHAIWRRLRLVPFNVTIAEDRQDKRLLEKLHAELPGILAKCVCGCLEWQKNGLGSPRAVEKATEVYRNEQDSLREFVDECCIKRPGERARASSLYGAYRKYCERTGEQPLSQKRFGAAISERGFQRTKSNGVLYKGLSVLEK